MREKSIYAAARAIGLCAQSVHERLARLGIARDGNGQPWTDQDTERLTREYRIFRDAGNLDALARAMGRTKPFICRQAGALGLTDQKRARPYLSKWKYMSDEAAGVLMARFKASSLGAGAFCRRFKYDVGGFSRLLSQRFPDEWEAVIEAKAPKQTMYRFGRQFEYRVRDALREFGYFVLRSPQSKSPTDLVAIRRGSVLLVQCKRGGALGVSEWNDLFDLAASVGAVPLLAEAGALRGRINYWRLLDRKDGSKKAQPRGAFLPEHA